MTKHVLAYADTHVLPEDLIMDTLDEYLGDAKIRVQLKPIAVGMKRNTSTALRDYFEVDPVHLPISTVDRVHNHILVQCMEDVFMLGDAVEKVVLFTADPTAFSEMLARFQALNISAECIKIDHSSTDGLRVF